MSGATTLWTTAKRWERDAAGGGGTRHCECSAALMVGGDTTLLRYLALNASRTAMISSPLLSPEYLCVVSLTTPTMQRAQVVTRKCLESEEGRFKTGPAS